MECTGDRQEYHTDGTLHITLTDITCVRNVQGTDSKIVLVCTNQFTVQVFNIPVYSTCTALNKWYMYIQDKT